MKHHLSDRRPATYFCRELIFTFLALLCFAGYASGVEVWSGIGPAGGQVNILAVDPVTPTTLYAGGSGGVFQSTTAGASWAAASKGITETTILALAIDPENPDTLYAGTDGGGVFVSTNAGMRWTAMNTGLTNKVVNALAINPENTSLVYAGTKSGGVFLLNQPWRDTSYWPMFLLLL